jgi:hydroxypyruvate isomerase
MSVKFSANLSLLFTEVPFLERFSKAAENGFGAVEFHFPYDTDINEIRSRLNDLGLELVLFNLHPGDLEKSEWGTLGNPDRKDYFHWSLTTALEIANRLRCNQINVMFGNRIPGVAPENQIQCALDNLAWSVKRAESNGITLLIEALNPYDFPSVFLQSPTAASNIVQTFNHPNVKLLYDIYHAQMTEGNLINSIKHFYPFINHIQIADVPGRHEPGTGEINYSSIFIALNALGYQGFVGLEYRPSGNTDASLGWFAKYRSG